MAHKLFAFVQIGNPGAYAADKSSPGPAALFTITSGSALEGASSPSFTRLFSTGENGRNTVKHVPCRGSPILLRTRILPRFFWTMPWLTHKPRPVPLVSLVLKNGS